MTTELYFKIPPIVIQKALIAREVKIQKNATTNCHIDIVLSERQIIYVR